MTKKEKYAYNVQQCIKLIIQEVDKLSLNHKSASFKDKKISLIVAEKAKNFKLKYSYIKVIYLGKSNLKYV